MQILSPPCEQIGRIDGLKDLRLRISASCVHQLGMIILSTGAGCDFLAHEPGDQHFQILTCLQDIIS
eukprot:6359615-Amphidinium_carterae.1